MMYMTPNEAQARLSERHGITAELYIGDLIMACEELRSQAPFTDDVNLDGELPEPLMDWIALRANELRQTVTGPPPATRITTDGVTVELELGRSDRDLHRLVYPYLKRKGRIA